MNKLEIIKVFLEDEALMEEYEITQQDISRLNLSPLHSNNMIALIQKAVAIIEDDKHTLNTAASNINSFLETRLRES